jgi:hypothetical protein
MQFSPKEWLQVSIQSAFEFTHEQCPLLLARLKDELEDSFDEFNTHRGAEGTLRRGEVWRTDLKAHLEASL